MALLTDNFDSYTTGGLNGQGTWVATAQYQVSTAQNQSSPNSVANTNFEDVAQKAIAGEPTSGTQSFYFRCTDVTTNGIMFVKLHNTAVANYGGVAVRGGFLTVWDGAAYTNVGAVSVDTWYQATFDFTSTQIRAKLDAGSYTAWINLNATIAKVTHIRIDPGLADTAGTTYYDTFVDEAAPVVSGSKLFGLMGVGT